MPNLDEREDEEATNPPGCELTYRHKQGVFYDFILFLHNEPPPAKVNVYMLAKGQHFLLAHKKK